jgi:hypothetical protein
MLFCCWSSLTFILTQNPGKHICSTEYRYCHDLGLISMGLESCHLILPDHGPWQNDRHPSTSSRITKHVNSKTACHATRRLAAFCSFVVTRYGRRQYAGSVGIETQSNGCCLSLLDLRFRVEHGVDGTAFPADSKYRARSHGMSGRAI